MANVHIEASAVIDARPADVYAVLSDYRIGHPAILPKPAFSDLFVEQGGQGAGTVIRFSVTVSGTKRNFHEVVSEPEPGRVLVETDDTGLVTRFIHDPLDGGKQTRVTITTDYKASAGIMGLMERWSSPLLIGRLYRQELRQIADYVSKKYAVR